MAAFLGLLDPRLWSLLLARGAHAVLTTSLFRSSYELLFTPVPKERKRLTKTLIDVGFDKVGSVAGSVIALAVVTLLPAEAVRVLLAIVVLTALVSLLVTSWLHEGYVGALEASLRSGAVRLAPDEVKDATTRFFFTRTGGAEPSSACPRSRPGRPARPPAGGRTPTPWPAPSPICALAIAPASCGPCPRARTRTPPWSPSSSPCSRTTRCWARPCAPCGGWRRASSASSPTPCSIPGQNVVVRRRVPRVLVAAPGARTVEGLLRGLEDERFDVRARCAPRPPSPPRA